MAPFAVAAARTASSRSALSLALSRRFRFNDGAVNALWRYRYPPRKQVLPNPAHQRSYSQTRIILQEYQSSLSLFNSLSERIEPLVVSTVDNSTSTAPDANATKGLACYTCGPTVYGPAHLGHARTYVWLDILRRLVEYEHSATSGTTHLATATATSAPPPLFVLNITDVDDKILHEAERRNVSPASLARSYEAEFWNDMDALNCLRPHVVTRVSEHVESDIIPYIQQLVDNQMAYDTSAVLEPTTESDTVATDSDTAPTTTHHGVYFDVRSYEEQMGSMTRYGKLAPSSRATDTFHRTPSHSVEGDAAQSTAMATPDHTVSVKRDARDFALWKRRKHGEQVYWDSPWGLGRPGWHIECSAMIHAVARQFQTTHTFLMHAGGVDLKFPHHTNEIAQAEAHAFDPNVAWNHQNATNATVASHAREWIRHWVHTGHLHIDGLKMSKSLKNFVTIQDFLSGRTEQESSATDAPHTVDAIGARADDFRWWCLGLSGSYRGLATYSVERMQESRNVRNKVVRFLLEGEEWILRGREQATNDSVSGKWSDDDCEFYTTIHSAVARGRKALLCDLDGSTFLEQLVLISDNGRAYMTDRTKSHSVVEPLSLAVQSVRSLLTLVGFTDAMCQAGVMQTSDDATPLSTQARAMIQELARFRSAVRRAAIADHKDKEIKPSDNMKNILKLCDEARDEIFPALGIELIDAGVSGDSGSNEVNQPMASDWRYCVPRPRLTKSEAVAMNSSIRRARAARSIESSYVPPSMFFKVGPYEGLFAEYNDDGFPLRSADMAELSNTQTKKLRKVFVRHIRQWQQRIKQKDKRNKEQKKGRLVKKSTDARTKEFQLEMDRLTLQLTSEQSNHPSSGSPKT